MKRLKRLRTSVVLLVLIFTLGAGTAVATGIAGGGDNNAVTGTQVAPSTEPADGPPQEMPATLRASFRVFREAARATDRPDAELARRLGVIGANPDLARLVLSSKAASHSYYAVPGRQRTVCVVDETASGGCVPQEIAVERGTISSDECPQGLPADRILVYGLVPDGVSDVALTAPNGTSQAAQVESNFWSAAVARTPADVRPAKASWTSAGGAKASYSIPYSPDVDSQCDG